MKERGFFDPPFCRSKFAPLFFCDIALFEISSAMAAFPSKPVPSFVRFSRALELCLLLSLVDCCHPLFPETKKTVSVPVFGFFRVGHFDLI